MHLHRDTETAESEEGLVRLGQAILGRLHPGWLRHAGRHVRPEAGVEHHLLGIVGPSLDEGVAVEDLFDPGRGGGYPFVGSPDRVAEELAIVSRAGIRGIAVSFVNYVDELPFFRDQKNFVGKVLGGWQAQILKTSAK